MRRSRFLGVAGVVLVLALVSGCDPNSVGPTTQPAASLPASSPTAAPAATKFAESQPAGGPTSAPVSQPTSRPETQPTSTSAPVPDPPPKFLKVVQTDRSGAAGTIKAKVGPGSKLSLDTENVRRLRILREELELPRGRSIVLQLDGQVIEWRANSPVREFERTPAGVWQPVRPK